MLVRSVHGEIMFVVFLHSNLFLCTYCTVVCSMCTCSYLAGFLGQITRKATPKGR